MKAYHYILALSLLAGFTGCKDTWGEHYAMQDDALDNDKVELVDANLIDFLSSKSDYSDTYALFKQSGLLERMNSSEQLLTILVTKNNGQAKAVETDADLLYKAQSHVSDISLSPSNITNGQRVLMWNGKYLSLTKTAGENGDVIAFNGAVVQKVIKTNNGFIYELATDVVSPKSLYEVLEGLSDDYSIFKNLVLSRNQKVFDVENSKPIGIDNTGNTVYDSVWVVKNSYFASQGLDIMSENIQATMLIPSDAVIQKALTQAKQNLSDWHMQREDSILNNWFMQVAFFDKKYSAADLTTTDVEKQDLESVFDRQWRTSVQRINTTDSIPLSNGVAFYVTDMKIPTNMLIFRLKDYMKYYADISDGDKAKYFPVQDNLTFRNVKQAVAPWSGWPAAGFPKISNVELNFTLTDSKEKPQSGTYTLEFIPFKYQAETSGYTTEEYLVPPGEYDLCLGFKQKLGHDVDVYFNDEFVATISASMLTKTDFHYDRGGQGYPEGYDTKKATDKKKANYDRDGGKVGVVTVTGTEAKPVRLKFVGRKVPSNGYKTTFHHWCLKPTVNCY